MQAEKKTKTHSGWNRLLVIILCISVILGSLLAVFRNNFTTGAKAYLFLKEAKAYENISDLAKVEIEKNLPNSIKDNFIKKALVQKIIDITITPENVQKIAEPGIINLYKLSGKAANLASKKIEFNTVEFKNQAEQYLPKLGLSNSFTDTTLEFVKSVPDDISILNVEKNPNSPLAIFLKIRAAYNALNQATNIVWGIALVSLLGILVINIKNINKLLSSLYWSLGVAGSIILAITYILPPIALSFMPAGSDASETTAINNLVSGILSKYLELVRGYGWVFIIIALIAYFIHWIYNSKKAKEQFAKLKNYTKNKIKTRKK